MSAWLQTEDLTQWKRRIPLNVFGSRRPLSAEATAMLLQDKFAKGGGVFASLDLSQAYDRMAPQISRDFLVVLGWDPSFCNLVSMAWQDQVRWLSWQGETLAEPLTGLRATPQGCPMAPLYLCLWVAAGLKEVAAQLPQPRPLQAAYMDDRSAVLHDWAQTEEWVRLWHDWSRAVGLKENSRKIQVAARGPAKVEVDRLCPPRVEKS